MGTFIYKSCPSHMTKQGFAWILLITRLLLFLPHSAAALQPLPCNRVVMKSVLSHLQSSSQQEFSEYCLRFTDIILDNRRSSEQKREICRNTSVSCLTLSFQSVFSLM